MTQPLASDFPIDPTTTSGTALADILNRFSDSVNSSNAGATAPPDTTPGMLWLDTSSGANGVLRMRNAANTGWVTISTPGGPTGLVDGSIASPGLQFNYEPTLGWTRLATSMVSFVAQGVRQFDMDFSNPTNSVVAMYPRQAGGASAFTILASPYGVSPSTPLSLSVADDHATISTSKLLYLQAATLSYVGGNATFQYGVSVGGDMTVTGATNANAGVLLQVSGAAYQSFITQYAADGRFVIGRNVSDWSDGNISLYANKMELNCGSAGMLSYSPGALGLALQGAATTAAAASVAAVWEGDRHSYRVVTSARRFKKDFEPLPDGALSAVLALKPLTYTSAIEGDTTARMPGFVAEDFVDAGLADYVTFQEGEVFSLKYERVTALLAKAMQELAARVAALAPAAPAAT
jgi:hypothetical protein